MKSALLAQRIIPNRFSLDMTSAQAESMLRGCYMAEVELRGGKYSEDEHLRAAMRNIAEYLTTPTMGKFGMMFCGLVGNGKTTMVRALNEAVKWWSAMKGFDGEYKSFAIVTAKDIVRGAGIPQKCELLAIDDLGEEPVEKVDYGSVCTPIVDKLEQRYNMQLFTVITTNLTSQEIGDKYGLRIRDRLREMMYKIDFKQTKSYRK